MPREQTQTASFSSKSRNKRSYPVVMITQEMIDEADRLIPGTKVERTIASRIDTLTGHLGEFAAAQFLFGDWRKHRVGKNKGEVDFSDIEVKTSAYPFSESLHLLVREDYARKRKPKFYVQVILDVNSETAQEILPHTKALLCGYATADEVDAAPLKDFGSKLGGKGGYQCRYIKIGRLHRISTLRLLFRRSSSVK
jgi:hypothetical protein